MDEPDGKSGEVPTSSRQFQLAKAGYSNSQQKGTLGQRPKKLFCPDVRGFDGVSVES